MVVYVSNSKINVIDKWDKFLNLSKIFRIKNSMIILYYNPKELMLIHISTRLTW
jgi:hypothetical protein